MSQTLETKKPSNKGERWFWVASPQAMWRTPVICLFVPATVLLTTQWFSLSSRGINLVTGIWSFLSLPAFLAMIGILICPFQLLSKKRRRGAILGLISSAAFLLSFVFGVTIEERMRRAAFLDLAERSKPLIQAIQTYEEKNDFPPATLAALVPEFLVAIPRTGIGAYPEYRYVVGEEAQRFNTNPWVLYVSTPSGGISFDKFLYFPLQNYPERGYGGWLERIGDWAYVHE